MPIISKVFTKYAATGPQVVGGLGFRPTWVLLVWNGCTALDTIQSDFGFGYGCGVMNTGYGEGQGSHWSAVADSAVTANPDACRIDRYTSIFVKAAVAPSGSPSPTDEAVLTSCDSDGFTLNWTTNSGSADLVLAICGTHSQAAMDNVSLFLGSPAAVTDLGFVPTALLAMIKRTDCVGTLCATSLASGSSSANNMGGSLGFCDQNDVNGGAGWNNVVGGFLSGWKSPQETALLRDRRIVRFLGVDGFNGASNDYLDVTLDSGGYSFAGFASATPTWIQSFLALGGAGSAVGHQTGSGTVSPGFQPALAIVLSNTNSSNVADVSFGVFDGTNHYAVTSSAFSGGSDSRTAREFSSGVAARVFNAPNATSTSTTTKQTVTASFGSGSVVFTAAGSSNEFVYFLLGDPAQSSYNLLTGEGHTVQGSDNLIAGLGGTVTGDRNALFALNAGSPAAEIAGTNTFKVVADLIDLESNVLTGSGHTVDGSDNLIAGTGGTVTGDRNALFALCDDVSPSHHEIAGNNTFKVCADTIELIADTVLVNGVELVPAPIRVVTVTLTDAQIKALPTTPIVLVAAPGVGKSVVPLDYFLVMKASASYTNISEAFPWLAIRYTDHTPASGFIGDDNSIGSPAVVTQFTEFFAFGSGEKRYRLPNAYYDDRGNAGGWGLITDPTGNGSNNSAIEIYIDNGSNGNLTGGNGANTLAVAATYLVLEL